MIHRSSYSLWEQRNVHQQLFSDGVAKQFQRANLWKVVEAFTQSRSTKLHERLCTFM